MYQLNPNTYEKYKNIILNYMKYKISIGDDSLVTRKELSDRFIINKYYVSNILNLLVKENILENHKKGYYKLIVSRETINNGNF